MAIKFDKDTDPDAFAEFVTGFNAAHRGADNAYKTLFLAGGADIVPMSVDFRQLDFKMTQGAGETRMSMVGGVPAAILGISEGLQGSTLNSGNFQAAKRLFAETTLADLWGKAAASWTSVIDQPRTADGGRNEAARLAVDARHIPFLSENATDQADIRTKDAQTVRQLVDVGFDPDAAVDFVTSNDLRRMRGKHSGLFSVQLQPPGADQEPPAPSTNGRANGTEVPALRR